MRIIKLPNCPYDLFVQIREEIFAKVPYAIINTEYHRETGTAFLYFWDSDYIPAELIKYKVNPPAEIKFDFSKIDLSKIGPPQS